MTAIPIPKSGLSLDQIKLLIYAKALGILSLHCEAFLNMPRGSMDAAINLTMQTLEGLSSEEIQYEYEVAFNKLKTEPQDAD